MFCARMNLGYTAQKWSFSLVAKMLHIIFDKYIQATVELLHSLVILRYSTTKWYR